MKANEKAKSGKAKKEKKQARSGRFFKEFFGEVGKLTWLTPKDLMVMSLAVFAFVALFAIVIGILDAGFGAGFNLLSQLG